MKPKAPMRLLDVLPKSRNLRTSPWLGYLLALLLNLVALILTLMLWSVVADTKYLLFWAAIIVSAWRGGLGSGIFATLLAVLAGNFLLPSARGLTGNPTEILQITIFIFIASLVGWIEQQRIDTVSKLEATNARLQVVIASVSDGITVQDKEGTVLIANDAAAELTGYNSTKDLLGLQMGRIQRRYELSNIDGAPFPFESLPRHSVFRDGTSHKASFRMRLGDTGEERWIELKSTPVRDVDGKVQLAVNIFRDVTQEKEYEAVLKQERAYLRKILNSIVAFVGVLNAEGHLIEANEPSLRASAKQPNEVIGKHLADTEAWAYAPEPQTQLREAVERVQAGETVRYDVQVRVANGQFMMMDFMLAPLYDEGGRLEFIIASGLDITERRRKEEQVAHMTMLLDAQRQRLSRIMNAIPAIVFEITTNTQNGQSTVEFVNNFAERMLGYPIQMWRDDPQFGGTIIHPDDFQPLIERATEIYTTQSTGTMEYRYLAQDGRVVYVEAYMDVIRDTMNNPVGACGVVLEVTERKQAELALERQTQELKRSNEELEQFAYIASHDLQEPLRMVTSYLQLLDQRHGDKLAGEAREFMNFAVDGANRMKKLIQDLLSYSRVQRTRTPFTSVDLDGVLDTAMKNLSVPLDESGATISFGTLPTVPGDEGLLTQLFQNLIGNAIKFRRDDPPVIKIDHEPKGHEWVLSVRDNGIGIDAKYLDRVFDIFQRLHSASKYPGTGIGLAICRRIVEHHGGRIWAESEVGGGTTFYFTLPKTLTNTKIPDVSLQKVGAK
jgi:PAS domain S-box-containing protein